jgi:hypothetical protein
MSDFLMSDFDEIFGWGNIPKGKITRIHLMMSFIVIRLSGIPELCFAIIPQKIRHPTLHLFVRSNRNYFFAEIIFLLVIAADDHQFILGILSYQVLVQSNTISI